MVRAVHSLIIWGFTLCYAVAAYQTFFGEDVLRELKLWRISGVLLASAIVLEILTRDEKKNIIKKEDTEEESSTKENS